MFEAAKTYSIQGFLNYLMNHAEAQDIVIRSPKNTGIQINGYHMESFKWDANDKIIPPKVTAFIKTNGSGKYEMIPINQDNMSEKDIEEFIAQRDIDFAEDPTPDASEFFMINATAADKKSIISKALYTQLGKLLVGKKYKRVYRDVGQPFISKFKADNRSLYLDAEFPPSRSDANHYSPEAHDVLPETIKIIKKFATDKNLNYRIITSNDPNYPIIIEFFE